MAKREPKPTSPEKRELLVNSLMDRFNPADKEASRSAFTDIVNQSNNDRYNWHGYGMVPPGTLRGTSIDGQSAEGMHTGLSLGDITMVEDQGDPIVNGLLWAHEVEHGEGDQAQRPLPLNSGFENIYDKASPGQKASLDYMRRENEMKSSYKEIDYINNYIDGGYDGAPLNEKIDNLALKFKLFSDGLEKAMGEDYNKTMVEKVLNWDRKGK